MGIQGLLPLLKDVQSPTHVSQFKGQTLGIDGYVWLHRGAYGCADKLVKGEQTTKYVNYALYRIRMLRHHGVNPYVVFDGDRLPSKSGTEKDRESRRNECLAKARQLEVTGRGSSAYELYAKCIDITPEMAYQLIKALKAEGVPYVVAPYEADAQLAYLERTGVIDAIVTEDSDLLVFGCNRVLFKMDSNGDCFEVCKARLIACRTIALSGWTSDLFRQMAILSGCDYLPSISGMGLKVAHRLLQRYKTVKKVLQAVRLEGKMRVPPDYAEQFEQAEKTFIYQRVWDPATKQLTTLNPIGNDIDQSLMTYIGPDMDPDEARGIANGDIDPISRKPMQDIVPRYRPVCGVGAKAGQLSRTPLKSKINHSTVGTSSASGPLKAYFSRGGPSATPLSHSRPALAVKNMNVKPDVDNQSSSPPVRSIFFGGKVKGVEKGLPVEAPPTTPRHNDRRGTTAPIPSPSPSAMGDYYFELDGGDPRILMEGDDEAERIPAFADYTDDAGGDAKTAPITRIHLASFEPTQVVSGGSGCDEDDSEVSSIASTSPLRNGMKRKYDESSLASESDSELDVQPKHGSGPVRLRFSSDEEKLSADDHHDHLSSPCAGNSQCDQPACSSPLQDRSSTARSTASLLNAPGRPHCLDEENEDDDDIAQHSDEDAHRRTAAPPHSHSKVLGMTGGAVSPADDLWSRFGHRPATSAPPKHQQHQPQPRRPFVGKNSNAASPSSLTSLHRTPSNSRPLRLYESPSPCQSVAFAKVASASAIEPRPKLGLTLSTSSLDNTALPSSKTTTAAARTTPRPMRPRPKSSLSMQSIGGRGHDKENDDGVLSHRTKPAVKRAKTAHAGLALRSTSSSGQSTSHHSSSSSSILNSFRFQPQH